MPFTFCFDTICEAEEISPKHTRKIGLLPGVELIYNMNTGKPNIEFEVLKDSGMGISLSNIYIPEFGKHLKLNIDEKFIKNVDYDKVDKYTLIDKYGKKQTSTGDSTCLLSPLHIRTGM